MSDTPTPELVARLRWEEGPPATCTFVARTPFNYQYTIWEINGTGCWTDADIPGRLVGDGLDGAKAAAQADYERRVLSALERLSSPAGEIELETTEADIESLRQLCEEWQFSSDMQGWVSGRVETLLRDFARLQAEVARLKALLPKGVTNE